MPGSGEHTDSSFYPILFQYFNFKFFSGKVLNYFESLVFRTIKLREENKLVRHDVLHLMLEARKGNLKADNESEVVAKGRRIGPPGDS